MRSRLLDLSCLLLVAGLSLLSACYYFECTSLENLAQPWCTFNDVPLTQALAKVVAEGDARPWKARVVERLNAPFTANWCDFPAPDELVWGYFGLLTYFFGVIRGYNIALLTAHVLAGCGFYTAARMLGASRAPSVFCAVSYAMARFLFARDTVHINLSYCWHLPFLWVAARWLWRGQPLTPKIWAGMISLCAVCAWQNPYFWFFWLCMLVPCWAVHLAGRRLKQATAPVLLSAASVFFLFLGQSSCLIGWHKFGKGHPYIRTIDELSLYALRLPEMLLPAGHHWSRFDELAYLRYYGPMRWHALETNSSYLGFIGIASLLYLTVLGVRGWIAQKPVPFYFGMNLWLSALMACGGLVMTAGAFGLLLFRSNGRCAILIQAGLLLFLAEKLTSWGTFRGLRALLIPLPLLFTAWDCIPPYLDDRRQIAAYIHNQKAVVDFLEARLAPKSMVFQWPISEYPEAPKVLDLWNYEQLMGFLYSRDLRFSYGNCRWRPEAEWQRHLVGCSPEQIENTIEGFGFSALWLYTNGLTSEQLKPWKEWKRKPDFRSPWGDLWVYLLRPKSPAQRPKLEATRVLSTNFSEVQADSHLDFRYRNVWGPARIQLLVPPGCRQHYRFGLSNLGEHARPLQVFLDGRPHSRMLAPTQYATWRQLDFDLAQLKPGDHRIDIVPGGPALPPLPDGQRFTFIFVNESFTPVKSPQEERHGDPYI
ncbi:MAG: hypothetical protein KF760_06870 [Candidatus Eremiobacteraeota bacterium]|nr:hypothetical protein [Candidatus Eremiobacteraeota bacterium]MCW5866784.1 hypothetical protein [Candidatus Eremiobacteraeota bacterium]